MSSTIELSSQHRAPLGSIINKPQHEKANGNSMNGVHNQNEEDFEINCKENKPLVEMTTINKKIIVKNQSKTLPPNSCLINTSTNQTGNNKDSQTNGSKNPSDANANDSQLKSKKRLDFLFWFILGNFSLKFRYNFFFYNLEFNLSPTKN